MIMIVIVIVKRRWSPLSPVLYMWQPKKQRQIKNHYASVWTNSDWNSLYPEFEGIEGPTTWMDPQESNALDYVKLLWGGEICELIAEETNRYVCQETCERLGAHTC